MLYISYMFIVQVVMCLIVDIYEIVWLTVHKLSHIIVFLIICLKLII